MSVSAYTTAVMACRKLLMHIAVEKGAEPNKSFNHYVDWMVEHHYVPPGGSGWVDVIRDDANEVNHEIALMTQHRGLGGHRSSSGAAREIAARAGRPPIRI